MTINDSSIPTTASYILTQLKDNFTGKTTDGNGEVDLTLTRTPTALNKITVIVGNAGYIATAKTLVAKVLTVVVKKLAYDKTTTVETSGALINLATGVTEAGTAPILDSSGPSELDCPNCLSSGAAHLPTNTHSHATTLTKIPTHQHNSTISTTETNMPLATTTANLNFSVIYS